MKPPAHPSRRRFVRRAAALSTLALAQRLDLVRVVSAADAASAAATDYRALVCVFLFGGNDGNNTVVPLDGAGYAQYAAARPAASGIQLAQSALLPVQTPGAASVYGLHPELGALRTLFDTRRLAIVANVGTLVRPTTRAQYAAGVRPQSLYSHSDQQAQWQSAVVDAPVATGWGGRLADRLSDENAAGGGFPVVTSLGGTVLFTTGAASSPLAIPASGSFALAGYGGSATASARLAALTELAAHDDPNTFVRGVNAISRQALGLSTLVNPILANTSSPVASIFSGLNTGTSRQLLQVAKMIEARAATGAKRQIFFVQQGGYDTHSNQLARQQALFAELAPALKAFYDATVALGVAAQVTTFTLSDFGRTLQPAAGGGSDHAWGSHHFVVGDAVRGGELYGRFPQLLLGGPDDAEKEGRWIPTTSLDQYGATLARWFGADAEQLAAVFPNLARFPQADLGFLT